MNNGQLLTEWYFQFCYPCPDAAQCNTEQKCLACFEQSGLPVAEVMPEPTTEELLWQYYQ